MIMFVIRALFDKWMQHSEDKRAERAMKMKQFKAEAEAMNSVRNKIGTMLFGITGATIAILSVFFIIGVPICAPVIGAFFDVKIPVSYGYYEQGHDFLFFWTGVEETKFHTTFGIPIYPFHTHLISGIAGAYFGKIRK